MTDQPTLTDGTVTLRPWRDSDVAAAEAGHDELIARWLGEGTPVGRPDDEPGVVAFVVEHDGQVVGSVVLQREDGDSAGVRWALYAGHRHRGYATRATRVVVDWALTGREQGGLGLSRVHARVDADNEASLRVATRSGLRREGVQRVVAGTGERPEAEAYVVLSRLSTDPPLSEPGAFRALLNSFLPRKRAIAQVLVRDSAGPDARVLLCGLTYKQDWDLPGGVVEVGESPQLAAAREVEEELGFRVSADRLLLTDWLPPWGGWDDALCLVFDGGVRDDIDPARLHLQAREIRAAEFCTPEQVADRCADFTARRITAALAALTGGASYTESGR
ncbi:NUDIX hydrolase [Nocardioides litoris]|uniref:NUDIX hydrolase n=1 Tax=Nocardioides litoris TaxID=1926648 RepID=UPI001FEC5153|nr:NUDIX hydrolase [Nocardioides litoris]